MKNIKISYAKTTPKGAVLFTFVKGNTHKFVVRDNVETLEIGISDFKSIDERALRLLFRKVIRVAKSHKVKKLARNRSFYEFTKCNKLSNEEIAKLFMQEVELANFEFVALKSKPKEGFDVVDEITFVGNVSAHTKKGLAKGQTIGEYINKARTIANTPGGVMTPTLLAGEAKKLVKGTPVKVTAFDEKKLTEMKAGGILGVARGSKTPPRLIIMEYWGSGTSKKDPIVLVGKGITFDSGGLSLKPTNSMVEMHMDMAGGAAVMAAIALAAKLGVKKNIVALIPAAENMPGGESYRPGDVLTSMSGKTIEILNTDAEGRVVLADALTYAKKYNPKLCVDVATLTGASMVALGERTSALMTKDEKLQKLFMELSTQSGDRVWPLPLWDDYLEDIRGRFGDIANANTGKSYGGAITAGMFLSQFADNMPWVHIDMAPRMTSIPSDNLAQGASGEPIRLLLALLETY